MVGVPILVSAAPALPCGSFEGEKTNLQGLSGTRTNVPLIRLAVFGNIDRQDRQDKQDERRLQGKQTGSMIGCVFEVIHERGSGFWESLSKHRRWLNSRR